MCCGWLSNSADEMVLQCVLVVKHLWVGESQHYSLAPSGVCSEKCSSDNDQRTCSEEHETLAIFEMNSMQIVIFLLLRGKWWANINHNSLVILLFTICQEKTKT